ncbi:MAG: hypothetical protein ACO1G9_01200 [Bacteroidota bacterium]
MKTKTLILLIAFAISIGFNVVAITSAVEEVSPCDNTNRYKDEQAGGGISVSAGEAAEMVSAYRNSHKGDESPYKTTGFFLSKRICDEVFKDGSANTLLLSLINNNGQLNLAVKAVNSPNTALDKRNGSDVYILQTFCPDDCSGW